MCVRICNLSYSDADVVNSRDVSSEDTTYPFNNVDLEKPRTKVWRSTGYWNVTLSNNGIVFNEGASNLTASITVGEYAGVTSFCAAIKSALEASGANTYTVTQLSNKKIKITSSATPFSLIWTDSGSTAYDLIGFANSTDRTGASNYTADLIRIHEYEFMHWDMGVESKPKALVLVGPRNVPLKFSDTAVFTLEGSETDNFSSPSFSQIIEGDNEVIFAQADDCFHTDALRFWRLKIVDQNPTGYLEAGTVYLGSYTEFTNGKAIFPFDYGLVDRTDVIYSEGGQSFSNIKPKSAEFGIEYNFMSKDEVEEFREIFDTYGVHNPFFMIFDSPEYFTTSANRLVRLVRFKDAPKIALVRPNMFSMSLSFSEEL